MPTRAGLLAIFSVSCAAMVLSVAVPVVIVQNSFDDSLFDRPCNHQPCNSVAEGGHRMPLRYPALSEICRNAQLAGTWVFDLNGSHLDRPCNHQPCNSVAEGGHRMPLRYPALSEICRNAQLAGTWVFDLNGSHLSLIPPRFNGCPDGLDSFIAESPGVAKTCGGEARAFSDET